MEIVDGTGHGGQGRWAWRSRRRSGYAGGGWIRPRKSIFGSVDPATQPLEDDLPVLYDADATMLPPGAASLVLCNADPATTPSSACQGVEPVFGLRPE
jgi:hypothetical protein